MTAAPTVIDLLRHGATAGGACLRGGRTDDPLSERGWAQLRAAATPGHGWNVIAASGLQRSRDFARWLAAERGCELVIDERLDEYDFGAWDGVAFADLWREHGNDLAAFFGDPDTVTPPGGERAADFRARVRAAREALAAAHGGRHILVIGHGGVLRQWVADVVGARGNTHAALEWPHAAMSRVRAFGAPGEHPAWSLVFHGLQPNG